MKNFRSSKNLRAVDTNSKEESQLRMRVKALEEQVQMLQKSNLNILIPLSQQEHKPLNNNEALISKLKTQILTLQQQIQRLKTALKKSQSQKELQKISFHGQLQDLRSDLQKMRQLNEQLKQDNEQLRQNFLLEEEKRRQKERQCIEIGVELRFAKEDLANERKRKQTAERKHQQLLSCILAVSFNSRIYKSKEIPITAIETSQLKKLKAYCEQLEKRIRELNNPKVQRVYHGSRRDNIGQQIVRLKQNIDLQLGLQVNNESTKSFLTAYNQASNKFNELITSCKISPT